MGYLRCTRSGMHASSCQPYHHRPGGIADRLEALYDSGTWTDVDMVVESMKIFDSSLNHYTAYGNRSVVPRAARYSSGA